LQVEEILAARFPKADVPERVRVKALSPDRYAVQFTADSEFRELLEQARAAREVYVRDAGCCGFVGKNGRRCGTRVFLEMDHARPFALGGEATAENLKLRCRAHNQWQAWRYFGRARMRAAAA